MTVTPGQVRSFTVTLADGISELDAEAIAAAIGLLKGVVSVQPFGGDADLQSARASIDAEWRHRIVGLLDDEGV
jgi:hypothetical protein